MSCSLSLSRYRYRPPSRFFPSLLVGLAALLGAASSPAQKVEGISPLEADSSRFGTVFNLPIFSYNDVTARARAVLPSVGVPGLTVTPIVRSQVLDNDVQHSEYNVLGWGGSIGLGYLSAGDPTSIQDGTYYYEQGAGRKVTFARDYLFQDVPNSGNPTNPTQAPFINFIDTSLRRLSRDTSVPFGQGRFYLLEPNGRKIVFEPALQRLRSWDFLPVEIIGANGRTTTIHYVMSGDQMTPRMDYMEDEDGRRLRFYYEEASAPGAEESLDDWQEGGSTEGDYLLERIQLEGAGVSTQVLARFQYQEVATAHGSKPRLWKMTTPEGHVTEIGFSDMHLDGYNLDYVRLPEGGEIEITWEQVTLEPGYVWDGTTREVIGPRVRWIRLLHASEQPLDYGFVYENRTTTHPNFRGEWLDVTVNGPDGYQSRTTYHNMTTTWDDVGTGIYDIYFPLAGYPESRSETYRGNTRLEAWEYDTVLLWSTPFTPPVGDSPPAYTDRSAFQHLVRPNLYSVLRDGVWIDTDYEYRFNHETVDDVADPATLDGAVRQPTHVEMGPRDSTARRIQDFVYENRANRGHDPTLFLGDQPYSLPLQVLAVETLRDSKGHVRTLGKVSTAYTHPTFPFPTSTRRWFDEQGYIEREVRYHDSGPYAGYPSMEAAGGTAYATWFREYSFGQPSLIDPPAGPDIVREINAEGTVANETVDGVETAYLYDADRRLVETSWPLDAPRTVSYSPPVTGEPGGAETCLDNWIEVSQEERRDQDCLDGWGRAGRRESDIDAGVTGITSTFFDDLGRATRTISRTGALTESVVDVWGRPDEVVTYESDATGAPQVNYQKFQYSIDAITGVSQVHETLKLRESDTEQVIRVTETDLAGRMVSAGYGESGARTLFTYEVDTEERGITEITAYPDGGPERKRWVDWLGRTVKTENPEVGTTYYQYDGRGLLVERRNVNDDGVETDRYRFTHDALGRVIEEEAYWDGGYHTTREFSFHPHNNKLAQAAAATDDAERAVRTIFSTADFDAQQRPLRSTLTIPKPYPPVDGLRPAGEFDATADLPLRWFGHDAAVRYVVEFRRRDLNSLRFDTTGTEVQLSEPVFAAAVSSQLSGSSRTAYQQDMAANPLGFLDPAQRYQWRVRAFSRQHEPTPWSDWLNLSNGCRIESFVVEDGVDTGPLIQWRTAECEDGEHIVRVRVSTLPGTTEPGCALNDGLFSGHPSNNQTAHFMAIGYNYEDVQAAHNNDPDYAPNYFGPKDCAPLAAADFRIDVEHDPTGDIVDSREPLRARVLQGNQGCRVFNFYVNDGYDGQPPEVTWQTRGCQGRHVEIRRSTLDPTIDSACELFEDPWQVGQNGQVSADFMATGWIGSDGSECDPVSEAAFTIEIRGQADADSVVLASRPPVVGEIDPEHGGACHVRYLGTDIDSPTNLPTELLWQTEGCSDRLVWVRTSTVDGVVAPDCLLRQEIFSTGHQGPQEALFMAEGYYGYDDADCGVVPEADFWVELWDAGAEGEGFGTPGGTGGLGEDENSGDGDSEGDKAQKAKSGSRLLYRGLPVRTEYTGPLTGPKRSCQILDFDIENRGEELPVVSWQTDCSDPGPISVQVKTTTPAVTGPDCRLDGALWDGHKNGARTADYMVGGYSTPQAPGASCPAVEQAQFWIELRDETNGSALIDQSQTLTAIYQPTPPPCQVLGFSVTEDVNGGPIVSWQTDCPAGGPISVQVRTTTGPSTPAHCAVTDALWDGSKNGSRRADFMVGGYGANCGCPAVDNAWFQVKLYDTSDGNRLVQQTSSLEATYQEPADLPCRILGCSAVSGSGPGELPVISWQTSCPESGPVSVEVKTTTSPSVPSACRLNGALWDGHKNGSRTADYMAGGYSPDGQPGVLCPAVSGSWFWVELHWGNRLIKRSDFLWTTYDELQGPCSVQSFDIDDSGTSGVLPQVNWSTTCSASDGVTVDVKTSTIGQVPTACMRDGEIWSQSFAGSEAASYMAGEGACGPIEHAQFWLEIRDASNPSLLYERTSYFDAYYTAP